MKKNLTFSLLRAIAVVVVLAGAGTSLALTLHAGRNNKSVLLPALFFIWVLSPFIALMVAIAVSERWPALARAALYSFMIVLTLSSLVCYSGLLSPKGTKPAFVFLIVPLISWLVIAIAAWRARRLLLKHNAA